MFCEVSILVIWIDMYMYFSLILSVFLTLLSTLSFPHSLSLYVTLCTCIFRFLSIFLKPFSFYFCPSLLLKLYFSTFYFFLSFPLPPLSLSLPLSSTPLSMNIHYHKNVRSYCVKLT